MPTDHLFEKYYFSDPGFVDGTTEFHQLLAEQIKPESSILEIGSGPANATTSYLATLGRVIGLDITREIDTNMALAEAHTFDGMHLPFPDEQFDACVSNWVIEHVQDASTHFREVARVLRAGGTYCFRTPNQWHYFTLGSRLVPFSVHVRISSRLRGLPADAHDPYPTYYCANTFPRIRRLCYQSGLIPVALFAIEKEPSYGRFHPALFYPMFIYERLVNSCSVLKVFRASLVAVLRKPRFLGKRADTSAARLENLYADPRTSD
jgi:ubiquinone/menaquinone biosynthesis C-methylase UbiE